MLTDQFHKGLGNIIQAVEAAVKDRRVQGAQISHDAHESNRQRVQVCLTVGDKSEVEYFEPQEVEDCGQAIDAPAALKVRMLVSHFVR